MLLIADIGANMHIRTTADFAALIRHSRQQLGLDQAALAKRIGVSRQWVIAVEGGQSGTSLSLVLRAVDALGLRLNASSSSSSGGGGGGGSGSGGSGGVDIDAIISSARKEKR